MPRFEIDYMKPEEIAFLKSHLTKDRKLFVTTMRALVFIAILIPTGVWLFYSVNNDAAMEQQQLEKGIEPYTIWYYLATVGFLLVLLAAGAYFGYLRPIGKQKKDIREGLKIIERTKILRKRFISSNQSCYLFLDSEVKLNIQISPAQFSRFEEGDEVNIEYSKNAHIYLGYF